MQSKSIAPSFEQLIRPVWNIVPTVLKSSIIDTTVAIRLREVKLFVPFLNRKYSCVCLITGSESASVLNPTFP